MNKNKLLQAMLIASLVLTGCGNSGKDAPKADENKEVSQAQDVSKEEVKEDEAEQSSSTVKIKNIHGEVEVARNPKKVVALDNRTFETLSDFGVKLVAAPKDVMAKTSAYVGDDSVENIGNHREPNLELLAAADPDLVIVGQIFAKYYEQIKELLLNSTVVDFSYDVSEKSEHPGDNLINGFKESTLAPGEIFEKQDKAKDLVDKLDNSIKEAKEAYKGQSVMSLVVSGGDVG